MSHHNPRPDQNDEWAIPAPPPLRSVATGATASIRPTVLHQHRGVGYAFPVSIITVDEAHFHALKTKGVIDMCSVPDRITLIIAVQDCNMDVVAKVLRDYAAAMEERACIATPEFMAPFLFRAMDLAEAPMGILLNTGSYLKNNYREQSRSACETIMAQLDEIREAHSHQFRIYPPCAVTVPATSA